MEAKEVSKQQGSKWASKVSKQASKQTSKQQMSKQQGSKQAKQWSWKNEKTKKYEKTKNEKWKMKNEKWKMKNEKWKLTIKHFRRTTRTILIKENNYHTVISRYYRNKTTGIALYGKRDYRPRIIRDENTFFFFFFFFGCCDGWIKVIKPHRTVY